MKTYGRKKNDDVGDIIVNLDEICRLCLAREEQLVPIFNEDEPVPLPIRIMACVALEVVEDDGLPAMICRPCQYQLEKYYVFRKKCESSDTKLRRHLKDATGSGGGLSEYSGDGEGEGDVEEGEIVGDEVGGAELPASEQDLVGSTVTFLIPEEGEGDAECQEEEETIEEDGAGGFTDRSERGTRNAGDKTLLQRNVSNPDSARLHCTLKRELSDEEDKDEDGGTSIEVQQRIEEMEGEDGEGEGEGDRAKGKESADELCLRLLPSADGAPAHVEVKAEDGSVLMIMELTTEDYENPEPQRDRNGELCVFQCEHCPKSFARKVQLRRHSSVHTEQHGVTCGECDKWFPSRSALRRHERIHTGEKPFQCGICRRCFAQKEVLLRHLLTHSETKPYTCPTCGKGFTQREPMRVHLLSHVQPRPALRLHRCTLCTKLFCHASGLSRHILTHAGRGYKCRDCEKTFNDKSALRRHHRSTGHRSATDVPHASLTIYPDKREHQ